MKLGAARVEITPPVGVPMHGYEARLGGATGVHDPLYVRVLTAEDEDGAAVALVVADLLQVDPGLAGLAADKILNAIGITRERLQLVGTHTHSGPMVQPGSEVERTIADRIEQAARLAWDGRREATGAVGVGHVEGIGANRRPHGGPVDDRVTVARFDDIAGSPIVALVNYGCHPTTLGPDNTLYSADYPGVLCRELDQAIGGLTIFTTGPQGDVNPGGYSPEGSMVGIVAPWRTFESAERYGKLLANEAASVHAALAPQRLAGRVGGASRIVELRRKSLPDAQVARRAAVAAAEASRQVVEARLSPDAAYHAQVSAAYADLIATQAADPERDGPVRLRVSALSLGPLTHIGVQGELFVALGQEIRGALDPDTTCIAALCDGTVGYIPIAEAFDEGGYEPNASILERGQGERLVGEVIDLARGVAPGPPAAASPAPS